ncbi:MAG: MBL fold metallo-hydrolase [Dehalococcoidia bacterium]
MKRDAGKALHLSHRSEEPANPVPDQLLPGLWWLDRTRGCNVYLQRTLDDGAVIVDTGFGSNGRVIRDQVHALGFEGRVRAILLTHRHVDHTGAAASLVELLGAPVVAGLGDCHTTAEGVTTLARDWSPPALIRRPIGMLLGIGGSHRPVPVARPVDAETEVAPGILAIPAPGHTAGTICYIATETGATFVGDLCISYHDRLVRSMRLANDSHRGYMRSLRQLSPRVGDIGLPGHGYPVLSGFRDRFRALPAVAADLASPRPSPLRRARTFLTFAGFVLRPRRPGRP